MEIYQARCDAPQCPVREMENNRKIAVFIIGLVFTGMLVTILFPREGARNADAAVRIGAGDDVSGILMNETVEEFDGDYVISKELESSSFKDC